MARPGGASVRSTRISYLFLRLLLHHGYGSDKLTFSPEGQHFRKDDRQDSLLDFQKLAVVVSDSYGYAVYADELLHSPSEIDKSSDFLNGLVSKINELASHRILCSARSHDLDERGTKLWNLSSQLSREQSLSSQILCLGTLTSRPPSTPSDNNSPRFRLPAPGCRSQDLDGHRSEYV